MLTRLYIDNYRGFVDFEFKPLRRQLVLGGNGSGKSSLLDALLFVRQVISLGSPLNSAFLSHQKTRWLKKPEMSFDIESDLEPGAYRYRLVISIADEPLKAQIVAETLHLNSNPLFEFVNGEVRLYNDQFELKNSYEFDAQRSALSTIDKRADTRMLTQFKRWVASLYCFRLNPYKVNARSESEQLYPNVDLTNLPSWYRHLVQADPVQNGPLLASLRECLSGFDFLHLDPVGENVRVLAAAFTASTEVVKYSYFELSDGQRALICLYIILHFVVARGGTVIIDEPENFISLREIQPWLMALSDLVDDGHGQAILISHHPEILNQWAPSSGAVFTRDENGPVRVSPFSDDSETLLTPAELIARGWERE